jgi:hypothetical protein
MTDLSTADEFEVGGVRLHRPFKIRRLGHFGVNVQDPEVSRDFYTPPARISRQVDNGNWLQTVPAASDTYSGEVYLGPWS